MFQRKGEPWNSYEENTFIITVNSMFMLFLLRPPTKPCYGDFTMHALKFVIIGPTIAL